MGTYTPKSTGTKPQGTGQAAKPEQKKPLDFIDASSDTFDGFQDINAQTQAIPFLRILQGQTPFLDKKKPDTYINGAEEGMFFNTVTKTLYGAKITLIALNMARVFIEWLPERGGFVGYHTPEHAELIVTEESKKQFGKWRTENGNVLQENYVYLVLVKGHENEGPMVFSLASTMITPAKMWNRMLNTHMVNGERVVPYVLYFSVHTETRTKGKNTWFVPVFTFEDYVPKEIFLQFVRPERKLLPTRTIDYSLLESERDDSGDGQETEDSRNEQETEGDGF